MNTATISRRQFTRTVLLAGAGIAARRAMAAPHSSPAASNRVKLGLDNFAVRAMGWKAPALIDYAASLQLDSLLISDLDSLESFEADYLAGLKARAADRGLQIHLGTWSICPTSYFQFNS